jgi:hypothetical protein
MWAALSAMTIQECIASLEACTAKLKEATAKLEEQRLAAWLRIEPRMLPKWKRQPHGFKTLRDEVTVQGNAHSVRTMYMRPNYTQRDAEYLQRCVNAQHSITANEANTILRSMKPDRSYGKRRPAEANPDPDMRAQYRARPERRLSPYELIMESGLKGRALQRELARIK